MAAIKDPSQPEATLGRVLDDLGSTFLRPVHTVPDLGQRVGGVTIHDPLDEQAHAEGAIVLGVGLTAGPDVDDLLVDLGRRGASALVLREPVQLGPETEAAATDNGVAVLALTRGASWTQLGALLRSLLAERDLPTADGEALGAPPAGDLFTLANAIAALLDAPITIEDRSSRVLAFSGRQEEADSSRIATILERQVPERYSRLLTDAGFFKQMYASDGPVHIRLDAEGERIKTRAAMAVRAGDEVLGSIWAAVPEELSRERADAMRDAAKMVALHLLRIRAGSDAERRLRADLLGTALQGEEGAGHALARLGLADTSVVVLAATVPTDPEEGNLDGLGSLALHRQRISDAIAMHLSAVHPRSCAALLGDTAYALLPVHQAENGEAQAMRLATEFLNRIGRQRPAFIGVGPPARGPEELARSRRSADRALRVLLAQGHPESRAALLSEVHVEALLLELRDRVTARGETATGPVARLLAHDSEHDTDLVQTLRTWLDTMGDITAAAESLHIHPNTFRYRLRRLSEIGSLDLKDPESRFAAMLQLRVMPELAAPTAGSTEQF